MRKAGTRLTWAGNAGALGLTSLVPALLGTVSEKELTNHILYRGRAWPWFSSHMRNGIQKTAADQAAAEVSYAHL